MLTPSTDTRLLELVAGRSHDPFAFLGCHPGPEGHVVRVYEPHADSVEIVGLGPMEKSDARGLFEWHGSHAPELPYLLRISNAHAGYERYDPYCFPPLLSEYDLYLFNEGRLLQAYDMLGAHPARVNGIDGVRFATWAPNAERVSVVGDFNQWDGRVYPMRSRGSSGVWELFLPGIRPGAHYKFEIRNRASGQVLVKADPYARWFERRPGTAPRVCAHSAHTWQDGAWLERRRHWDWLHAPINVYEVHAGSWRRHPDGRFYSYRELADSLVPYLQDMGYTHVELLPISEHPLDESWGYQTTGYFAPTSRYGTPDDFRAFVDACHQADIGVILDWVPAHFPQDDWALARFDGTALYEHEDPRRGYHQDWGTHIFNYGRAEVKNFLLASAHYWLSEFHLDGLRVDAVASMLYLDYSRKPGEWLPNRFGGRENLEAIDFLRELNIMVHEEFPGALTFAEESTAWPMVSRPAYLGGLGFSLKWNMGWMNDTLSYMHEDPVHRRWHHNKLTFGQLYAYTENFILPLSHDEVVHGKGSLLAKMPGDVWQQFANLRLLMAWQLVSPGKKLNFMGNEFGQGREWQVGWELDWPLLGIGWHAGIRNLARDLNRLYRDDAALHALDFESAGFQWLDCNDADHSIYSFMRRAPDGQCTIAVLNFTPVPRHGYRVGVPAPGYYREILNTDAALYGGSNAGNGGGVNSEAQPWMEQPHSAILTLPPLAGVLLKI
ncbi:MAG: 1,4-alpha-glucan branching protein GlgB [Pseudomonadota bacterium]